MSEPHSGFTYVQAKAANASIKVQKARRQLQRLQARYVEREKVITAVYDMAADSRQQWLMWVDAASQSLAKTWGANPVQVQTLVTKSLQQHLAELGEFDFTLIDTDTNEFDI